MHNRILVIRLDRIGDVVLSTPAIKALRDTFPKSYIAFMGRPVTKDIMAGNPYLDEVILYDKDNKHKGPWSSLRFAMALRKKKFDLAVILHPTNRSHIIAFLAGIPERLGYNKKCGFLLTRKTEDTKRQGLRHEAEYSLDLLKALGVQVKDARLFMPVNKDDESTVVEFLKKLHVRKEDKIVTIHPGASCPSKIWPKERLAKVADALANEFNLRIAIVSDNKDAEIAEEMGKLMSSSPLVLGGKLTLGELAALLKKSCLFISNDSGPVHIAAALDIPVISIFGRNQPGLSPRRWRPLGKGNIYLHKQAGCIRCSAHNCEMGFKCLLAITEDDVLNAARSILKKNEQQLEQI